MTRTCGPCTACCVQLGIQELSKPVGARCPDLAPAGGCSRYATRPRECAEFRCAWHLGHLGDQDRPDLVGVLVCGPPDEVVERFGPNTVLAFELAPGALKTPAGLVLLAQMKDLGLNVLACRRS